MQTALNNDNRPWLFVAIAAVAIIILAGIVIGNIESEPFVSLFTVILIVAFLATVVLGIMFIYRTDVNKYSMYLMDSPFRRSLPQNLPIALDGENGLQPEYDTPGWILRAPFFRKRLVVDMPEGLAGEKVYLIAPFGKDPISPNLSGPDIAWEQVFGNEDVDWEDIKDNLDKLTRGVQRRIFFGGGKIMSIPPYIMVVTRTRVYYYDKEAPEYKSIVDENDKPRLDVLGFKEEDFKPKKVMPQMDEPGSNDTRTGAMARRALQVTVKEGPVWTGASLEESGLWWPEIDVDSPEYKEQKERLQAEVDKDQAKGFIKPPDVFDRIVLPMLLKAPSAPIGDINACLEGWKPGAAKNSTHLARIHRGPMARLLLEGQYVYNSRYVETKEVELPLTDTNQVGVIMSLIGPTDPNPYDDGTVHVTFRGVWKMVLDRGMVWPFSRACFDLYSVYAGVLEGNWAEDECGTFDLSEEWEPFQIATLEGFEETTEGIKAVPFIHVRIPRPKASYVVRRYGEGARTPREILDSLMKRLKSLVEETFRAWIANKPVEQMLNNAHGLSAEFSKHLEAVLEGREGALTEQTVESAGADEKVSKVVVGFKSKDPEDYGVTLVKFGVRFTNWPNRYMQLLRDVTYAKQQAKVYTEQATTQVKRKALNEATAQADMATVEKRAELYATMSKKINEIMASRGEEIKRVLTATGLSLTSDHIITFVRQLLLDDAMFIQLGQGGIPLSRIVGMLAGNTAAQPLVSQFASSGQGDLSSLAGVLKMVLDPLAEQLKPVVTAAQEAASHTAQPAHNASAETPKADQKTK